MPAPPFAPTPAPPPFPSHAEAGSGGSKREGTGAGGAGTDEAEPGKGGRRPEQAGSSATTPDFEAPAPEIEGEVDLDPVSGRFSFLSLPSKNCMSAMKKHDFSSQYVLIYDAARIYDMICMKSMKSCYELYKILANIHVSSLLAL
jgi:hypothetical protein